MKIERREYMERLCDWRDKQIIKVIPVFVDAASHFFWKCIRSGCERRGSGRNVLYP